MLFLKHHIQVSILTLNIYVCWFVWGSREAHTPCIQNKENVNIEKVKWKKGNRCLPVWLNMSFWAKIFIS